MLNDNFYFNKKVLVTGHSGFKGVWLTHILLELGANVIGYSKSPETVPDLYSLTNIKSHIDEYIADICDFDKVSDVIKTHKPDIVLHLAAQPIVSVGYSNPFETYNTNVMGTVNLLESIRLNSMDSTKSIVNVTTDKVYLNREWDWGYREDEPLNGFDPYSNSKSCSDIITQSYNNSFFKDNGIAVSTMRAGNVIGGGDFSLNRIIPDCYRASVENKSIPIRMPNSIRPYQHVLEPLFAYLLLAQKQYQDMSFASSYNIGPEDFDCITTKNLVEHFCNYWGDNSSFVVKENSDFHEASFLKLDASKIKNKLNWKPQFNVRTAVEKTVDWYKAFSHNEDYKNIMINQIKDYNKGDYIDGKCVFRL